MVSTQIVLMASLSLKDRSFTFVSLPVVFLGTRLESFFVLSVLTFILSPPNDAIVESSSLVRLFALFKPPKRPALDLILERASLDIRDFLFRFSCLSF